jgi:hypothetical protein
LNLSVAPGLNDRQAVLFSPKLNQILTVVPLQSQLATLFGPSIGLKVTPGLNDRSAVLFNPTLTLRLNVSPPLNDRAATLFSFVLTGGETLVPPVYRAGQVEWSAGPDLWITPPATTQVNDLLLAIVETGANTVDVVPTGGSETWFSLPGSPQSLSGLSKSYFFWARASQNAPTAVDFLGSGVVDHMIGAVAVYSGVSHAGDPWNVFSFGGTDGSDDTSSTIGGTTTTVANTRVVMLAGHYKDKTGTEVSAIANTDLTNIVKRHDQSTSINNGGGVVVADGLKAVAGAYGNTVVTTLTSNQMAWHTVALKAKEPLLTSVDVTTTLGVNQTRSRGYQRTLDVVGPVLAVVTRTTALTFRQTIAVVTRFRHRKVGV